MELFVSKQAVGTDARTSWANCGNKLKVTARLAVSYFNWIWPHGRSRDPAAQRARLALAKPLLWRITPWSWNDFATYPTFY